MSAGGVNCKLTGEFFSVVKLLQEEQKLPKDYGTGQKLYHSEVNVLEAVYTHIDANVSELSSVLEITRGAVTQIARKLYDKGLIEYYMLHENKKEKYIRLTEAGEAARKGHALFHEEANQKLCAYFCSLNKEERHTISEFLQVLKESAPFCESACKEPACSQNERRD